MKKNSEQIIAIIPARGGSKGIPDKNIIPFCGKPLLAWSIEQALNTRQISGVYVSTNDDRIAAVAREYGAEVIPRPDNLCQDTSTSEDALIHALDYLRSEQGLEPYAVAFLQATSPLRLPGDIDNAITQFGDEDADSLFSGVRFEDFLFWRRSDSEWISVNYDYKNRGRRQDRPFQFAENGSIYIVKPYILVDHQNRLGGKIIGFEMKLWQTWQIDGVEDIELLEHFFTKYLRQRPLSLGQQIDMIVYDFDGVMTNNHATVDEKGKESVIVNRADGLAISLFKKMNIPQVILSTENNPVVARRAEKLGIPVIQGVSDKKTALQQYLLSLKIDPINTVYIGNDINDLEAMLAVGIPICPSDASLEVKRISAIITDSKGGEGVIREFFESYRPIINQNKADCK